MPRSYMLKSYRDEPIKLLAVTGVFLALCAFFYTPVARAADLIEVFQSAAQQDPQIRAAEAGMRAELEQIPQSRALLLPNLTVSASTETIDRDINGLEERYNTNGYDARLTQPLIRADRWFQLLAAKSTGKQARVEFDNAKQDLVIRVAEAYFNVLRAQDNLESAVAQETAFKRQLEQTQQRFDVGLIAITDVHEAKAAYDLARVSRITLAEARDNSLLALETLTDQTWSDILPLDKTLPINSPLPLALTEWVEQALASNLELRAARHQVDAARQEVKRQKSVHLPTLDAVVTYTHTDDGAVGFFGSGTEIDRESYALELNVPIFQGGGTRSAVRAAHYRLTQAKENYESQYRAVRQDIQTQYRAVSSDVLRVQARKLALRSSQSALEATEGGYEVGTRNIVDVLNSRNTLFESQRDYYNAIYDYILNSLRLKQTAGSLTNEDLVELNQWLIR